MDLVDNLDFVLFRMIEDSGLTDEEVADLFIDESDILQEDILIVLDEMRKKYADT